MDIANKYNKYLKSLKYLSLTIVEKYNILKTLEIKENLLIDLFDKFYIIIKKYKNKKKINILNLLYDYHKEYKSIKNDLFFLVKLYYIINTNINDYNSEYDKYLNMCIDLISKIIKLYYNQSGGADYAIPDAMLALFNPPTPINQSNINDIIDEMHSRILNDDLDAIAEYKYTAARAIVDGAEYITDSTFNYSDSSCIICSQKFITILTTRQQCKIISNTIGLNSYMCSWCTIYSIAEQFSMKRRYNDGRNPTLLPDTCIDTQSDQGRRDMLHRRNRCILDIHNNPITNVQKIDMLKIINIFVLIIHLRMFFKIMKNIL